MSFTKNTLFLLSSEWVTNKDELLLLLLLWKCYLREYGAGICPVELLSVTNLKSFPIMQITLCLGIQNQLLYSESCS